MHKTAATIAYIIVRHCLGGFYMIYIEDRRALCRIPSAHIYFSVAVAPLNLSVAIATNRQTMERTHDGCRSYIHWTSLSSPVTWLSSALALWVWLLTQQVSSKVLDQDCTYTIPECISSYFSRAWTCYGCACKQLQIPGYILVLSLVPRPLRGGGERRPGIHCMRMRRYYADFE